MTEKNYDLTIDEAIPRLRTELKQMRAASDREELTDIDSDTAFELGYETAIHDLARFTGPDPVETGIIVYRAEGATDDDH